jgi:rhodanese-related sulfurtransferase
MDNKQKLINLFDKFLSETKDDWNYITPTEFYTKYYNKKPFILDLRQKSDFEKFHIRGSTNIFWLDLMKEDNLDKLPKNKTIFLICYVGHTSSQALVLLKMLGYKVVAVKFGYGKSPVFGVPVAGWLNYNFPVV